MNLLREHDNTDYMREVARRFNHHPRKKVQADFSTLLGMFLDPEQNFSTIARTVGTSRQNVHRLYHQWFKPFAPNCGRPASREVEVSALIKKVIRRLNVVKHIGTKISLEWKVVLYQRTPEGAYSVNVFQLVNPSTGRIHLCRVVTTKGLILRGSKNSRYVRAQLSALRAEEVDFVIIVDQSFPGSKRFYLVPQRAALPFADKHGEIYFYIMENEEKSKQRTRSLAAYLEAWELLEEE